MFISNKFYDIKKEFINKKNSHSYMIYTNDFFSCQKDVNSLVKSVFNVENLNHIDSDYFVIPKSDKKNILKEDVQNLKYFFQNTSYINKYRIYLIEESHKLNSTSANMILKFLEEPYDGVIAFFITTNLDAVLTTIKSRCQIINVFYENSMNVDTDKNNKLKNFLYDKNKYFSIIKAKKYFEKVERGELIIMFNEYLKEIYNDINNLENINLIKRLTKVIKMLNNNVNIDYVFDYFFIGSDDCNDDY